ncbi:hypothetical protein T265_12209 [Opisthorchis viverrini]|uniref:Uncharacterized protein n=1 Tax=Opisthorchis viverrini TaxID=6198 RepID=A0A074YV44_OPIVI|nr:hypothetical protein T265_12209 [Opisthorchis viverrini]KER18631.1 hypothetical protein T265_12209 [Opisthorchis viverrini]
MTKYLIWTVYGAWFAIDTVEGKQKVCTTAEATVEDLIWFGIRFLLQKKTDHHVVMPGKMTIDFYAYTRQQIIIPVPHIWLSALPGQEVENERIQEHAYR